MSGAGDPIALYLTQAVDRVRYHTWGHPVNKWSEGPSLPGEWSTRRGHAPRGLSTLVPACPDFDTFNFVRFLFLGTPSDRTLKTRDPET